MKIHHYFAPKYPKTKEEMTNQKNLQNTEELQEELDQCSQEQLMVEHMMVNPNHDMFRGVGTCPG